MIVTIDGPAGAGKSHVARALADRLGFRFLDTGAMYRAVAVAALRRGVDWHDAERLAKLAAQASIEFDAGRVLLDGEDVTEAIRTTEVTGVIHYVADNQAVRRRLVELQQQIAATGKFVTEGRDQGTVAFPRADCKIFLTASPEERARRRQRDLALRGEAVTLDAVLTQQTDRDQRDENRPVGGLKRADDAVEVVTDGLTPDEVVEQLVHLVRDSFPL